MVGSVRSTGRIAPLQSTSAIKKTKPKQERGKTPVFEEPRKKQKKGEEETADHSQESRSRQRIFGEKEDTFRAAADEASGTAEEAPGESGSPVKIDVRV
jgi:hypothetical protein